MVYGHAKNNISPCYGCTKRHVDECFNCHDTCKEYLEWKGDLHQKKRGLYDQLNPPSSRYFKTKTSVMAPKSKAKYR